MLGRTILPSRTGGVAVRSGSKLKLLWSFRRLDAVNYDTQDGLSSSPSRA